MNLFQLKALRNELLPHFSATTRRRVESISANCRICNIPIREPGYICKRKKFPCRHHWAVIIDIARLPCFHICCFHRMITVHKDIEKEAAAAAATAVEELSEESVTEEATTAAAAVSVAVEAAAEQDADVEVIKEAIAEFQADAATKAILAAVAELE